MKCEGLGGQTGSERYVQEDGVPALGVHLQRSVRIFGHGFLTEPSHIIEGLSTDQRTRATEEGGIPEVISQLNPVVEEVLLRRHRSLHVEISKKWIRVVEVMRRLDQSQLLVL